VQTTADTLNQSILSDDPIIRNTAIEIITKRGISILETTKCVLQASDAFGLGDNLPYLYRLTHTPLDETSAYWLLDHLLKHEDYGILEADTAHLRTWLYNQAPISFLEQKIIPLTEALDFKLEEILARIDQSKLTKESIKEQVITYFEDVDDDKPYYDLDMPHIHRLISALPDDLHGWEEEVIAQLKKTPNNDTPTGTLGLHSYYIELVAKMQLAEALPYLIEHLEIDFECFNDELLQCLAELVTNEAFEQVMQLYRKYQPDQVLPTVYQEEGGRRTPAQGGYHLQLRRERGRQRCRWHPR
jgi:hypothetical protein